MSKPKENLTLEDRITSLRAITIPMLMVNAAIASLLSSLLLKVLNIDIVPLHYLASFTLAIGIGWTVLNTSVNAYLINNYIPIVFALGSFVLILIKLEVFKEETKHYSWYITRIFLALIGAAVEYIFSHLFTLKYQEEQKKKNAEDPKELLARLEKTLNRLNETETRLEQAELRLQESEEKLVYAKSHFYCRHCGEEFDNPNACKNHEAICEKNPKK